MEREVLDVVMLVIQDLAQKCKDWRAGVTIHRACYLACGTVDVSPNAMAISQEYPGTSIVYSVTYAITDSCHVLLPHAQYLKQWT
jgi:hypothetical protein